VRLCVVIFNLASSFYTAKAKTSSVGKTLNRCEWELQSRLNHLGWLEVVGSERTLQIPNVHKALLVGSNQKRPNAWHLLNRHSDVNFLLLLQLELPTPGPKLDTRIETSSHNDLNIAGWYNEDGYISYWLGVLTNILDYVRWKIPLFQSIISASQQQSWCIWLPAETEYGTTNVILDHRL